MRFRPLPVLTLVAVPTLSALVWLGVWQVQRAEWKADQIASFERLAASDPRPLEDILCSADPAAGDAIVTGDSVRSLLPAELEERPVVRMFAQSAAGQPGWLRLSAAPAPGCGEAGAPALVVETGFDRLQVGPVPPVAPGETPDPERYVVAPWPVKASFAAPNDPEANDWHWFDAAAMARSLGAPMINDRYYLKAFAGQLPDHLARTPPASHYGYAVTWFGIALAFLVIYAALHARAGRLRFRTDRTSESP